MTMTRMLVPALLALLPAAGLAAFPAEDARKTLDRAHAPVIVRTGTLTPVLDRDTRRYRLYAERDGRLAPIPYQFDPRGPDGELVLSADGDETDFAFDDDDELVFMAKDTGERVPEAALPAAADAALEIEVEERAGDAHGWAYLVHFPADPPPRSPVRYATFDPVRQEARALSYEVSYSHDRSNFLSTIRLPRASGGTADTLMGRLRMRISPTFSLLWTTLRPTFTEESFSVVPDGMRNGAVRAVRRVRQSLELGTLFPEIPNGRVYTYYYFDSFQTPARFSVPWLALKALRDFRFEWVGMLAEGGGVRYWDAANPDGVPLAGGRRPAGADDDHDWWVASGSRGTCLQALVIPEEWRAWGIKRGIVFADGSWDSGDSGAGYSLLRMANLRKPGSYAISSVFVVLPRPYESGDERELLAGFRAPLETEVRSLALERGGMRSVRVESTGPAGP